MLSNVAFFALLAVPVAPCSWTIAQTEIFRRFRELVGRWAKRKPESTPRALLAYLPTCYYCTSHYVGEAFMVLAFLGGASTETLKLGYPSAWGYIISSFTLIGVANVYLTGFNILRVVLRYAQAVANAQEAIAEKERAESERAALRAAKEASSFPSEEELELAGSRGGASWAA